MRKETFIAVAGLLATAFLVGAPAQALTIGPTGPGLVGTSNDTSACEPGCIPGADATWVLAYKQDVGGPESGFLTGSYQTSFFNPPGDPSDALRARSRTSRSGCRTRMTAATGTCRSRVRWRSSASACWASGRRAVARSDG